MPDLTTIWISLFCKNIIIQVPAFLARVYIWSFPKIMQDVLLQMLCLLHNWHLKEAEMFSLYGVTIGSYAILHLSRFGGAVRSIPDSQSKVQIRCLYIYI